MLVTASWGGAEVAVEVDAECRSVAALKRCLQEALPEVDVEAVRLEVCGRPVDDEGVVSLVEGSVIDVTATQAALAATALREEGCDVDFDGFCAAAEAGSVRICKLYLEAGVVWPSGFENPLHIAVKRDHQELAKLLLDSGCARDLVNDYRDTPLLCAMYEDSIPLCKLLLDSGCSTEVRNSSGDTPLHLACGMNDMQVAKHLLDSDCEKNETNNDGDTALHLAIYEGNMQLCKLLLSLGCSTEVRNSSGDTPLHIACAMKNTQVAEHLLDLGCEKNVKNASGNTPLGSCTEGTRLHACLVSRGCV